MNRHLKEIDLMSQIADRGIELAADGGRALVKLDTMMDLEYANKACPMDLEQFYAFHNADFMHDFNGIYMNFNRETKLMDNCFSPRCAKRFDLALDMLQKDWEGIGGTLVAEGVDEFGTIKRVMLHEIGGYSLFRYFRLANEWQVSVDLDSVTSEDIIKKLLS